MAQTLTADLGKMPLGLPLQGTLMRARDYTNQHGHAEITLEHLLLALTEDEDASVVLRASRVDLERLRDDVTAYISAHGERGPAGMRVEPRISSGLTQILKYASLAAQQGRRPRIDGAIVLAAVIGDGRSNAAGLLKAQGLTFEAAIRALQQGSGSGAAATTALAAPPVTAPATPSNGTAAPSVVREATEGAVRRAGGTFFDTEDILAAARARVQSREAQTRSAEAEKPEAAASASAPAKFDTAATAVASTAPATPPAAKPAPNGAEPDKSGRVVGDPPAPQIAASMAQGQAQAASRAAPPELPPSGASSDGDASAAEASRSGEPNAVTPPPLPGATQSTANSAVTSTGAASQRPATAPPPLPVAPTPEPSSATAPPTPPPSAPAWAPPPLPTLTARGGPIGPPPVPTLGREAAASRAEAAPPSQPQLQPQPQPPAAAAPPSHPPSVDMRQRPHPDAQRGPPSGPPTGSPQAPPPHAHPAHGQQPPGPALNGPGLRPAPYRADTPPGPPVGPDGGRRQQAPRRPAIEPAQVSYAVPTRMHAGVPRTVEVRIARTPLIAGTPSTQPYAQRGDVASARAISVRLRPMKGAFHVDATSPETQWERSAGGGRLGGDTAIWRFLVTPLEPGTSEMSLHVNAHVMGADGVLAETVLPEQIVAVRVTRQMSARLRRAGRIVLVAICGGLVFEAVLLTYRLGILAPVRRLFGL